MQFAEIAKHILRTDLDRARATGMQPAWTARDNLQRLRGRAGRDENGQRVRLHIEHVGFTIAAPMPPAAVRLCQRPPDTGGGRELILGLIAAEYLPDLEQRHIGKTSVRVLLRARHEARDKARP